jgi:hypothetical protein
MFYPVFYANKLNLKIKTGVNLNVVTRGKVNLW